MCLSFLFLHFDTVVVVVFTISTSLFMRPIEHQRWAIRYLWVTKHHLQPVLALSQLRKLANTLKAYLLFIQ